MSDLGNSTPHYYKATYSSGKAATVGLEFSSGVQQPSRGMEKLAFLKALDLQPSELTAVRAQLHPNDTATLDLAVKASSVGSPAAQKTSPQP
jgi:hypothetical protein